MEEQSDIEIQKDINLKQEYEKQEIDQMNNAEGVDKLLGKLQILMEDGLCEEMDYSTSNTEAPEKCTANCNIYKSYMFVKGQNEILQDSIVKYQKMALTYKKQAEKYKEDQEGTMWIISEKDTEIRILTKEKDQLQEKFLDLKLLHMSSKGDLNSKIKFLEDEVTKLKRELQGSSFNTQREKHQLQLQMNSMQHDESMRSGFGSPQANSTKYDTNFSAPRTNNGLLVPPLNLPGVQGRMSLAPPQTFNNQSFTSELSQTQNLKKQSKNISSKLKKSIGGYFKKEVKPALNGWNSSTNTVKSKQKNHGSFMMSNTDRSNFENDLVGKNNITQVYTEEDEEDMKEVMKLMNDQIVSKSKETARQREDHKKELSATKKANKKEIQKYEIQIADYKVQMSQLKQSIQDYEDFIEINKSTSQILSSEIQSKDDQIKSQLAEIIKISKLEEEIKEKDEQIEKLRKDYEKAQNRIQTLIKIQVEMRKQK